MNSPFSKQSWFRVCWTLSSEGRLSECGTLTGRDVPHMLVSLRDRLPLGPQDTETVRTAADTPEGMVVRVGHHDRPHPPHPSRFVAPALPMPGALGG